MNTIPKASDARTEALKNPSFERKVELYNSVVEKINQAVSQGKKGFTVSEAEYYALNKEILDKGYKVHDGTVIGALTAQISINVGGFLMGNEKEKATEDYEYKTYYFN